MPRINLIPDPPGFELDPELELGLEEPAPKKPRDAAREEVCPGCLGKGRYVGFATVEDPCRYCDGTGRARAQ